MKRKKTPLGMEIVRRLNELGMSQREFAREVGIAEGTLSAIIRNAQNPLGFKKYGEASILKVTSYLDISLALHKQE